MKKTNHKGTTYYEDCEGSIVAKVCSKCNKIKSLTDYNKDKGKLGDRSSICRECKCAYAKENQAYTSEAGRKYYASNRDARMSYNKEWRERNQDYGSKYYQRNREKLKETKQKWREQNHERVVEYDRIWRLSNPEKALLKDQRRRARKNALPDTFTPDLFDETLAYFNGGCALTGEPSDIHWDHVIPLATGHGGTIHGNMIPLRSDLNMSKNDTNIFEWFNANKTRFNLSQNKFDILIAWLAEMNGKTVEEYRDYVYCCHDTVSIFKAE